ncbi:hypothetical protein chiPu_0025841 [Chiloscyllium punctatum]|uniref:Uncharacterized protein n=1 Tax=Chiloscyllium punctatum TaxID=137246 RepID=A0A401TGB5_CHIPU|nr:hypothetical protein [Chiloscyllium punctatum]
MCFAPVITQPWYALTDHPQHVIFLRFQHIFFQNSHVAKVSANFSSDQTRQRDSESDLCCSQRTKKNRETVNEARVAYAQTKHWTVGELMYASLNLTTFEKISKRKQKKEPAEYAGVEMCKGSGNPWIP